MANIAKNAYRSRLAQNAKRREGPQGFHHNPGDFAEIATIRATETTAQCLLRKEWDFLPESKLRQAQKKSTRMVDAVCADEIEQEQYAFELL